MHIVAAFDPSQPTINATLPVPLAGQGLVAGTGPGGQLNLGGQLNSGKYVVFNESSISIGLQLPNGNTFYVPSSDRRLICASNWPNGVIQWWQRNVTAGPALISEVLIEYYAPGEQITEIFPAPIVRQVASTVASTQTLSNEGNPANTEVIDIGDVTFTKLIDIFNDGHANWSIDVSGVKHTIFQIALTANFLKIGQSGDMAEFLGNVTIDGTLTVAGLTSAAQVNATGVFKWLTAASQGLQSSSGVNVIDATSNTTTFINPPVTGTGHKVAFATNSVDRFEISDTGLALINSSIISLVTGAISRLTGSNATTCGSGTVITHGLGATPTAVVCTPAIAQPGSATVGVNNVNATTFTATVGAGTALAWYAWK